MRLASDLYTIYGELLVKKDRTITPAIVTDIRARGEKHKQASVPLVNTDVFADFAKVFNDKRYVNLLKSPATKKEVSDIAAGIQFENDLLSELSSVKLNLSYTYHHVLIIAALAIKLSLSYKPDKYDKQLVARCGFTHDIGKTRVPISILNKPARLTREERVIMKTHPVSGYLLLNYYLKKDRNACSLAGLSHHERLDGSGYPNGIKRIDKYAQLISVVDVLDALMTLRPYRDKAYSLRASLDYLLRESYAKRIDIDIVLALISLARKDRPDICAMKVSKEAREELPEELTSDKH